MSSELERQMELSKHINESQRAFSEALKNNRNSQPISTQQPPVVGVTPPEKRGYSLGKGLAGTAFFGPLGLILGFHGSEKRVASENQHRAPQSDFEFYGPMIFFFSMVVGLGYFLPIYAAFKLGKTGWLCLPIAITG